MDLVGTGLGALCQGDGFTRFRVWAPDRRKLEVVVEGEGPRRTFPLEPRPQGFFEGGAQVGPGALYWYRLDGGPTHNDPCSRFQPEGSHGPSMVVDPRAFAWEDGAFPGAPEKGAVLYELHVGAFTPEGTWRGAEQKLPHLRRLGVNVVGLMPANTFPGRFNWGYDGTHLFAPCAVYGTPDELRHFVQAAHAQGIAVILDVVYNHLGPDGNYLWQYARAYFSTQYAGEWGEALNFDGPSSEPVRLFVVENARHWISEYHLDGLRLDATQSLFDRSERHLVADITRAARDAAARKNLLIVAENEPQDRRTVMPESEGGYGCDALWVDDLHHSVHVAVTGNRGAYTRDYCGTASELLACVRHNALYQGQYSAWQGQARGSPLFDLPPERMVLFLQDHDQVANFVRGDRLHFWGLPKVRALTVLWLCAPQTPMLFMGQEFFASTPFKYFVDHKPELQREIVKGRAAFVAQFHNARHALEHEGLREDIGRLAFLSSRLDWSEAERHADGLLLHQELLRLRREDPVLARQGPTRLDGAVLGEQALVLRWFGGPDQGDRMLLLNLGAELSPESSPQPLLAPPAGRIWEPLLSSEEIRFGGCGAIFPSGEGQWTIPGQCGFVMKSGGTAARRRTPSDEARRKMEAR